MTTIAAEPAEVQNDEQAEQTGPDTARIEKAAELIASASRWSVAASLVPVPYVDLAALASVQTNLVVNLCSLYDQKVTKEAVSGLISVLLGTLVPAGAAQAVTGSLVKFVPGFGSLIGAVSMATFGAAATYAIGKIFVRHLENGGTLASFSAADIKEDLKRTFAQAPKGEARP